MLLIQIILRDDGGSDQGYSCKDDKKCECVLQTELTGLADG